MRQYMFLNELTMDEVNGVIMEYTGGIMPWRIHTFGASPSGNFYLLLEAIV